MEDHPSIPNSSHFSIACSKLIDKSKRRFTVYSLFDSSLAATRGVFGDNVSIRKQILNFKGKKKGY